MLLVGLANMLIDENIIRKQIVSYLQLIMGKQAALETFTVIDRVNIYDYNAAALAFSVSMLFFTSLRLFMQIQKALNEIWEVPEKKFHWKHLLLRRAYSFGLMLAIGFVLLVSFFITSVLTNLNEWIAATLPASFNAIFHLMNVTVSLALLSLMFSLILRILPDRHVPWEAALRGGGMSALIFLLGQYGLSVYFELIEPQSAYGVSGSLILLMLWVSYSSLALLFGAEYAYTHMRYAPSSEVHHGYYRTT